MNIYSLFRIGHLPMPTFSKFRTVADWWFVDYYSLSDIGFGLKRVRVGAYTAFILSVYRFSKFYSKLVYVYSVQ